MTDTVTQTVGNAGMRYEKNGRLVIGQMPVITMHADRENEAGLAIGPKRPILDLQPTLVRFGDLMDAMIQANDAGKPIDFLGHVRVIPTNVDEKITLTEKID